MAQKVVSHKKKEVYQCIFCKKDYSSAQNVQNHELVEHRNIRFFCLICANPKQYKAHISLAKHYKASHPQAKAPAISDYGTASDTGFKRRCVDVNESSNTQNRNNNNNNNNAAGGGVAGRTANIARGRGGYGGGSQCIANIAAHEKKILDDASHATSGTIHCIFLDATENPISLSGGSRSRGGRGGGLGRGVAKDADVEDDDEDDDMNDAQED